MRMRRTKKAGGAHWIARRVTSFARSQRDGAGANIHDNTIIKISDNPLSDCQNGIGILVGRAALSTAATATITVVANGLSAAHWASHGPVARGGSSSVVQNSLTDIVDRPASIATSQCTRILNTWVFCRAS
jgi:hypothetical protein